MEAYNGIHAANKIPVSRLPDLIQAYGVSLRELLKCPQPFCFPFMFCFIMNRFDFIKTLLLYSVYSIMVKSGKLLWVPFNPVITRTVESAKRSFLISHQTESMRE